MPQVSDTPTLAEVIRLIVDSKLALVETVLPGRILTYDEATQKASVQPLVRGAFVDDDGERVYLDLPIINNAPVAFPSGSGGSLTFPLTRGDRVVLLFASRDIDGWLTDDGDSNTPTDPRRHALSDVIVLPGVRSFAAALDSGAVDSNDLVLAASGLKLGSSAANQYIAIAALVASEVNTWISTVFDTHTHIGVTTGPGTSGVPSTLGSSVNGSNMESSKVRSE